MKRRDFSLALGAAVTANTLLQSPALAQAKSPEAGTDYQMLEKPAPDRKSRRVGKEC